MTFWSRWRYAIALTGITLLAGILRFTALGRIGIWGDEAATYGRVNGSFWQLLEVLQYDGFAPLHYELYFALARWFVLDPFMMRLWPAIAGTLTIPALYLIGRELFDKRIGLVAAMLGACSAYLLYYSRDAKMYAPMWLCVTMSMGCFLWWLNHGKRLGYWAWIFWTLGAAGIHLPGLVILAVQPVALLLHPRRTWLRLLLFLFGVTIILSAPLYHYLTFNKWFSRIAEDGWSRSMITWVAEYNYGRGLPELCRYTASAYATGWEWPDHSGDRDAITPRVLTSLQWTVIGIGIAVLLGVVPWSRVTAGLRSLFTRLIRRSHPTPASPPEEAAATPAILPTPPRRIGPWAMLLLFGVWIALPAYTAYCTSYPSGSPPWELFSWIWASWWSLSVAGLAVIGTGLSMKRWPDPLKFLGVLITLFGLLTAVYYGLYLKRNFDFSLASAFPYVTWQSKRATFAGAVWMPRYLGVLVPGVLVAAAWLLCRLPFGVRHLAIAGVLAINLANFGARIYLNNEPPVEQIVYGTMADRAAKDSENTPLVFTLNNFGNGFEPGASSPMGVSGRYYVSITRDIPFDPAEFRPGMFEGPRSFAPFLTLRTQLDPRSIRQVLNSRPNVTTLIFWQSAPPRGTGGFFGRFRGSNLANPFPAVLGDGWKLVSETTHQAYDPWKWVPLARTVRYQYERVSKDAPLFVPEPPPVRRSTNTPSPNRPPPSRPPQGKPSPTPSADSRTSPATSVSPPASQPAR